MKNLFLLRVDNGLNIVVKTDYKILSKPFAKKVQAKLVDMFGESADVSVSFIQRKLQPINAETFELNEYGNYDYDYANGFGTLRGNTVTFLNL